MTSEERKYHILLLGPPGSGKGTYAEGLAHELDLLHVATGDILREKVEEGDELAEEISSYIDNGELVPDEMIIRIIRDILTSDKVRKGFTLDGFPRTLPQAKMLDDMMEDLGWDFDYIFYVWAEKERIVERLANRVQCENCGAIYNMEDNPPENDSICDVCGEKMHHRPDDNRKVILHRFEVYEKDTAPVVDHYRGHPAFFKIYTGGPVGVAQIEMMNIINERQGQ